MVGGVGILPASMTGARKHWGGGEPKVEGNAVPIHGEEIENGETERHRDLIDMTRGPKLTLSEWNRLERCERPCAEEERGDVH